MIIRLPLLSGSADGVFLFFRAEAAYAKMNIVLSAIAWLVIVQSLAPTCDVNGAVDVQPGPYFAGQFAGTWHNMYGWLRLTKENALGLAASSESILIMSGVTVAS